MQIAVVICSAEQFGKAVPCRSCAGRRGRQALTHTMNLVFQHGDGRRGLDTIPDLELHTPPFSTALALVIWSHTRILSG